MKAEEFVLCLRREDLPKEWLGESVAVPLSANGIKSVFDAFPFEFRRRKEVETDLRFKQIIPYVLVLNPDREILVYQRHGTETRLHDLWSVGVGGHVNSSDQKNHTNAFDILVEGMKRECEEELGTANGKFRVLGLINEELTNVGKAHLGIVFSFVLESFLTGTSSELGKICFVEAENLKVLEVELWSRLALTLA